MSYSETLWLDGLQDLYTSVYTDAMKFPDINNKPALAAYLSAALAKPNTGEFTDALAQIVQAHGVAAVAGDAGLTRDALYKILRGDRKPQHETVVAILAAIGLRLAAEVITSK